MGTGARRARALAAILAACLVAFPAAGGDSAPALHPAPSEPGKFAFAGFDVGRSSRFAWLGLAGALRGPLHEAGPRLRAMGGVGRYRYRSGGVAGGTNHGNTVAGEFMIGWHRATPSVSGTVYAGVHVEERRLDAPDPGNSDVGTRLGAKAAIELFARPMPGWIAELTGAASTVNRSHYVRAGIAREVAPGLAAGIEGALLGDVRYRENRIGLLMRREFGTGGLTLSGGYLAHSSDGSGAYLTASLYAPF